MAIVLEANYAKKLGLPNYSSHQYSVTIRAELTDLSQIEAESARLYRTLQDVVDREIQIAGYVSSETKPPLETDAKNGHHPPDPTESNGVGWQCSGRQRELILTIAEERQLSLSRVEALAQESFGKELRQLNRPQASRIITRLLTA